MSELLVARIAATSAALRRARQVAKTWRESVVSLVAEKQKLEEVIARQNAYALEQARQIESLRRRLGIAPHDYEPATWRPGIDDVD